MHKEYAKLAVEALKSMYEHNSRGYTNVGRTDLGPNPITAEQVASDLRVIYDELTRVDS